MVGHSEANLDGAASSIQVSLLWPAQSLETKWTYKTEFSRL
jgi:hypothetical protein